MVMPADDGYQDVAALLAWHESGMRAPWKGPDPKQFLEAHCAANQVRRKRDREGGSGGAGSGARACVGPRGKGRLLLPLRLRLPTTHPPTRLPCLPTHSPPQLPAPCFNVFERDRTPARTHFCATAMLPHLGLQLTPDAVYPSPGWWLAGWLGGWVAGRTQRGAARRRQGLRVYWAAAWRRRRLHERRASHPLVPAPPLPTSPLLLQWTPCRTPPCWRCCTWRDPWRPTARWSPLRRRARWRRWAVGQGRSASGAGLAGPACLPATRGGSPCDRMPASPLLPGPTAAARVCDRA